MKALYIRFVLFLIGSAIRREIAFAQERRDALTLGKDRQLQAFSEELARFVDERIAKQRRPGGRLYSPGSDG
jgi:hypothetical protein